WPCCVTFSSTTSLSQSRRISCTCCTWPDSSPLNHSLPRERLKYTARPSSAVFARASRSIQANISTSPVAASWAITGTSPWASHRTSFNQSRVVLPPIVIPAQAGIQGALGPRLRGDDMASQPHGNPPFGHPRLRLAHGELAVVEDAGGQHGVGAA